MLSEELTNRLRKVTAFILSWMLVLNLVVPPLVLAEELESQNTITEQSTEQVTEQVTESPAPSTEPEASAEPLPAPTESPLPSPTPDAEVTTGDAYATSKSTSVVDTTLVDADLAITSGDVVSPEQGDLILATPESTESGEVVEATESGEVENNPDPGAGLAGENTARNETVATTGVSTGNNNQASSGNAAITTGEAVASAYATSLTNNTLINSRIQVVLLSIFTEWGGNIVLDPIEIDTGAIAAAVDHLEINNEGLVVTGAEAFAVTGENFQVAGADATMETGDGSAVAAAYSNVNMTAVNAAIVDLLVQNVWLWSGQVRNMTEPGSLQTPVEATGRTVLNASDSCSGCQVDLSVKNKSEVLTTATAIANTGGNSQIVGGSAYMNTGNAMASATAYTLANSTFVNSDYRAISINLLAPWKGDLIFAYPDLELTLTAPEKVKEGETINYQLTLYNRGYKAAKPVNLVTSLVPLELIPEIPPLSLVTRTYTLETNGRGGQTVIFAGQAYTVGGEESEANNGAEVMTKIESNTASTAKQENTETPQLTISANNNVNEFIYAGDGVQYEVKVTNTGPIASHDTKMVQVFVDQNGNSVQGVTGGLGNIAVNQTVTARFTLRTNNSLPSGSYHTETVAVGYSNLGREVDSNMVSNNILVKSRGPAGVVIPAIQASEKRGEEQVLGQTNAVTEDRCNNCEPWWWYLAVATASTAYFALLTKKWTVKKLLGNGLGIPLIGYGLFLLTNRECAQGLTYISSNPWCTWFLPVADGIFAVPAIISWKLGQKSPLARGKNVKTKTRFRR